MMRSRYLLPHQYFLVLGRVRAARATRQSNSLLNVHEWECRVRSITEVRRSWENVATL